jgi:hypothetical protein
MGGDIGHPAVYFQELELEHSALLIHVSVAVNLQQVRDNSNEHLR